TVILIAAGLAVVLGALIAVLVMHSRPTKAPPFPAPTPTVSTPAPATPALVLTTTTATTVNSSSTSAAAPAIIVAAPPAGPLELIRRGTEWRYHDAGVDLGTVWRAARYADGTWKHGLAPLGFGDPWIRTQVDSGSDPKKRYRTTYFRLSFTVPADRHLAALNLSLMRDDGAVLYLNGREVARSNMPAGAISFDTEASVVVANADEQRFFELTLDPADLHPGDNVLAVEIHQKGDASTDLGFDLGLVGK
ncbi:MAG TPA: hypothetical protein VHX44_16085, partial [Planctomycetota bacterium]|nr:hypothetical protein [Planctomycetota bacterium]